MKMYLPSTAIMAITVAVLSLSSTSQAEDNATEAGKSTFKVSGMKCESCENAVTKAVTKLDGVKTAEADAKKGEAVVTYDPAKVSTEKITAAINSTPFKVAQ